MKQFIQRHIVLMGIVIIGALAGLGFVACTSDDDVIKPSETISAVDNTEIDHFKAMLSSCVEEGKDVDLKPTAEEMDAHIKGVPVLSSSQKLEPVSRVYVEFREENLSSAVKTSRLQQISTMDDVMRLVREQGAIISMFDNEYADGYVELSNEKALEIAAPMIKECKQYLYGKGFSETEIQSMLSENGKVEADIIPFVLFLVEQEEYENQLINEYGFVVHSVTGLITEGDGSSIDPKFNWAKIGYCALKTIGLDIIQEIRNSGVKTLTKAVLKKAFKTVAKRLMGPVGAIYALYEVYDCYNN